MKEEPRLAAEHAAGAGALLFDDDADEILDRMVEKSASAQGPSGGMAAAAGAAGAAAIPGSPIPAGPAQPCAQPPSKAQLSGVRKAAVFVLSLDEEDASILLRSLKDDELGKVAAEIANLGVVERETVSSVMGEFRDLEQLHSLVREGGMERAARLVERSFPQEKAQRLLQVLQAERQNLPFLFLEGIEVDTLMAFLEEEHPQILAVVLAHLTPSKAAEILQRLSGDVRRDVIERIASLDGMNAEALLEVEGMLQRHLDSVRYEALGETGGVKAVAEILRAAAGEGAALLDDLRQDQPELADEIDKHLFVFEDLVQLDDLALQVVLREVDARILALALKNASHALRIKVLNNLARRAAESLRAEMHVVGPVKLHEVEAAQREILRTVLRLEQSGQLFISGRGREENRIVY